MTSQQSPHRGWVSAIISLMLASSAAFGATPVEDFACKTRPSGDVPFADARKIGEGHVRELIALSENSEKDKVRCWYGAVFMLGAVDSSDAVEHLKSYLLNGKGQLT